MSIFLLIGRKDWLNHKNEIAACHKQSRRIELAVFKVALLTILLAIIKTSHIRPILQFFALGPPGNEVCLQNRN